MNKICYKCKVCVYTQDFKEDKESDLFICVNCMPRTKLDKQISFEFNQYINE